MERNWNVVLITIDTVRPDHLGCYGHSKPTSPNIDRIASEGTVFTQAFTNGSYTKAAFPPILSSTYASMYGGPFYDVASQRPLVAGILNRRGYATAGVTANPLLGATVGYHQGFDSFHEPLPPAERRRWIQWRGVQRFLLQPEAANAALARLGIDTRPPAVYVKGNQITELALRWLRQRDPTRERFFLWVHYMDAHWPYHKESDLRTPRDLARAWRDNHLMWRAYKGAHPGEAVMERMIALYDEAIAFLDQQVGRLLGGFEQLGVLANTAIIVLSDHGEEFFEHGNWQHGEGEKLFDELLRVPLIVRLPGQAARASVAEPVSLLNIAPTILDMAGLPRAERMEGRSLLPLLENGSRWEERLIISEMVDLNRYYVSLRSEDYKYVYLENLQPDRLLFDLRNDPAESNNVIGEFPQVVRAFEEELQSHLKRVASTGGRDAQGNWKREDEIVRRLRALGYLD